VADLTPAEIAASLTPAQRSELAQWALPRRTVGPCGPAVRALARRGLVHDPDSDYNHGITDLGRAVAAELTRGEADPKTGQKASR
jgi:hypothetical protein